MNRVMLCLLAPLCAFAADVSGSWNFHLVRYGEEFGAARVELKSAGNQVTGTLNELKIEGALEGDQLHLKLVRPNGSEWGKLEGRLEGDRLAGTVRQGNDEFAWNARRSPAPGNTAPRTHTFEPTVFHRNFSGAITPALHINPGDTVKTWTVDAGGGDAKGVR